MLNNLVQKESVLLVFYVSVWLYAYFYATLICYYQNFMLFNELLLFRYGVYMGLLQDKSGAMNDLHMLLSTIKLQLKAQQHSNKPTLGKFHSHISSITCTLCYTALSLCIGFLKASQAGFDWFAATVFLIARGSLQTTLSTLQEISCLLTSAYLWPSRLHKSVRYMTLN